MDNPLSDLEDAILGLLEQAGVPTEINDQIVKLITDWEKSRAPKQLQRCRICGCTDVNACMPSDASGVRCFWIYDDLCSSCAGKAMLQEHAGHPDRQRDHLEAGIMMINAHLAMAAEYICEICEACGDDQAKIEACTTRPCDFRDPATGEIVAHYTEHPQLIAVRKRLEEALATLPPAPKPSSIILP